MSLLNGNRTEEELKLLYSKKEENSDEMVVSHAVELPKTVYEEVEYLSDAQISELWSQFPYVVQKAIKKERRGELKPVTVEELVALRNQYLFGGSDK